MPNNIQRIKSKPNIVYEQIRDDVLSGKYPGGTFLLERELCEELEVSRTPVREALIRLSNENIIEIIPNRGAFVPSITIDDIKEMCDLRVVNDGLAAFLCAKKVTQDVIHKMETSIAREETYISNMDFEAIPQEEMYFHDICVLNCGNKRLINILSSLSIQMSRFMRLSADINGLTHVKTSLDYHIQLLYAMRAADPEKARKVISRHWEDMEKGYIERYVAGTLSSRL